MVNSEITTCETLTPTTVTNQDPANYVCFGTTSKATCTGNPDKYMYRVVGVFPDEYGVEHVKLIKNTTIGSYAYNSSAIALLEWKDSDLYKGLNGSYFLTNTTYDYMQNTTWKNKIADWRWGSYNIGLSNRGSSNDMNTYWFGIDDTDITLQDIYNMETNNSNKVTLGGMWNFNTAKIGLLKYTDYKLAHPSYSLLDQDFTSSSFVAYERFDSSNWIHQNKTTGENEWTLLSYSNFANPLNVYSTRYVKIGASTSSYAPDATGSTNKRVRPVFYLNSNVELNSGTGTSTDPYIIKQ